MLYAHFDAYRSSIEARLREVRLLPAGGTPQSRTERDVLAHQLERRLASLAIGDLPLCFGRLDLEGGVRLYVGRVGLTGDADDPLLMDWRAPKAALFYSATPGSPEGVVRRRHLVIEDRKLVGIEDEVFDLDAVGDLSGHDLHGDGALLVALAHERTGHMRDIVATIQREQDAVIRSDLRGALVVQGGPGTGKTAVALHRAAYLLYAHRQRLVSSGVLVIGPSPVFLRYIERVLPSLGETGVAMSTGATLLPGVRPTAHDLEATAAQKASDAMVGLIAAAIRDRQRRARTPVEIAFERERVVLSREILERARQRGIRSVRPHNQARRSVESVLLDAAIGQIRARRVAEHLPEPDNDEITQTRRGLRRSWEFRAALERMWPVLSPFELLNDLFGVPALARSAAGAVGGVDPSALLRERAAAPERAAWTVEDVPLLDEAAHQLGPWTDRANSRAARQRAAEREREVRYARSVLRSMRLDLDISPESFADRFADPSSGRGPESPANEWTSRFGHVIVDESQELSPMAWRMIARRAPSRSMTIVGDLAQAGATWAPSRWADVLEPVARDNWRLVELSTNYRTPTEIMDLANAVLAVASPGTPPTVAIRSSGHGPTLERVGPGGGIDAAVRGTTALLGEIGSGRIAVIAVPSTVEALVGPLGRALGGDLDVGNPLGARVALVSVSDAKGLEFDGVVLVEPGEIARSHRRGQNDLYVALTRATQRLVLVTEGPLTVELTEALERTQR
jgi:hypothetical protein